MGVKSKESLKQLRKEEHSARRKWKGRPRKRGVNSNKSKVKEGRVIGRKEQRKEGRYEGRNGHIE